VLFGHLIIINISTKMRNHCRRVKAGIAIRHPDTTLKQKDFWRTEVGPSLKIRMLAEETTAVTHQGCNGLKAVAARSFACVVCGAY
jgi:hypothetical protein